MTAHYGYLKRSEGADGDQVDVYLAEKPVEGAPVYVFDQYSMDGRFDEHKAVAGVSTPEEAEAIYDAHFSDGQGPARRRFMQSMPATDFKKWATEGDTTKPLAPNSGISAESPVAQRAPTTNPEPRNANPVAESQAPAPSEPGDGRVAPAQDGVAPDPLMAQYEAAKAAGDTKTVQRLAHEINQAKSKKAETAAAGPAPELPFGKVGIMPNTADVVGLQDNRDGTATVMRGDEPFYDFENGDPIKVAAGATPEQVRQAITDAKALSGKDKWFGIRGSQTANAAPDVPAVRQQLFVDRGGQRFEGDSLEDAAKKWNTFRNSSGAGASEIGDSTMVVDQMARPSLAFHNSRIWPPGSGPGMKPWWRVIQAISTARRYDIYRRQARYRNVLARARTDRRQFSRHGEGEA